MLVQANKAILDYSTQLCVCFQCMIALAFFTMTKLNDSLCADICMIYCTGGRNSYYIFWGHLTEMDNFDELFLSKFYSQYSTRSIIALFLWKAENGDRYRWMIIAFMWLELLNIQEKLTRLIHFWIYAVKLDT